MAIYSCNSTLCHVARPLGAAQGAGPFPDDAHDLWGAFNAEEPDAPSPRTEVVHMVYGCPPTSQLCFALVSVSEPGISESTPFASRAPVARPRSRRC